MSLTRLLIGIVLVILIAYFVSEWRKWRARVRKEEELSMTEVEGDLLEMDEDIALQRADQRRRREDIDAINNPDEEQ